MKKRITLLAAVVSLLILAAVAWLEPTRTVRGWVSGEAFFANRSASYWRAKLASSDPVDQDETPRKLLAGGPEVVPVLAQLLSAPEPNVRWRAADLLGKLRESSWRATPQLAAVLKDPDPHVRSVAAQALGEIGPKGMDPAAVLGLKEMLATADKLPAIRSLAKLGVVSEPAIPDLIHLMVDPDATVRWNAARALGKIGPKSVIAVPDLVRSLKDKDDLMREQSAEALGNIGPAAAAAVPDLVAVLNDSFVKVRRDAVRSLGQIGPAAKKALPEVEKLLADPEEMVREAAKVAKRRIES